jgi:hypothetical protein
VSELFSFPDPVDEVSARLVAAGVVGLTAATIALDKPALLAPLTYGFAARVATGPTLSPLGQLVTKVVRPRLSAQPRPVPGPPKRLAQGMGLAMSATALALTATGRKKAAYGVLAGLLGAATLEAAFGYCVACKMFPLLMKAGVVPESACESCANLWAPRPAVEGSPAA